MITLMKDFPGNVLGATAEGKVTGTEYETILIPAVEEKFKTNKKIRLLYHLSASFSGFDLTAMLDDAKLGLKHYAGWEKIALVSDHHMINSFMNFFSHMVPGDIRIFKEEELETAKKWIVE